MMFRTIFSKSLYSMRWAGLGWMLGIISIAALTMAFFDSFNQSGIDSIVGSMPKELQGLIGDASDFKTIAGYIGQQIFGPNLYIVTMIMAIMLFVGISAREEESGVLQSLLSLPVSRTKVYLQKLLATTVIIAIATASIAIALWSTLAALNETADFGRIWQSIAMLFLLTLSYGLVAYSIAMATGRKSLTILVASVYAGASLIISTLAPAVDKLQTIDKLSLLHYYNSPQIMSHGITGSHVVVLSVVCLTLIVVGWIGFTRRDIYAN